jgi:hypothetical protein
MSVVYYKTFYILIKAFSQFIIFFPKLKCFKHFSKKAHSSESKAFSKSIIKIIPGFLVFSKQYIKSVTIRVHSPICFLLTKPFRHFGIKGSRQVLILLAKTPDRIL